MHRRGHMSSKVAGVKIRPNTRRHSALPLDEEEVVQRAWDEAHEEGGSIRSWVGMRLAHTRRHAARRRRRAPVERDHGHVYRRRGQAGAHQACASAGRQHRERPHYHHDACCCARRWEPQVPGESPRSAPSATAREWARVCCGRQPPRSLRSLHDPGAPLPLSPLLIAVRDRKRVTRPGTELGQRSVRQLAQGSAA
jgi:hypothetical protein